MLEEVVFEEVVFEEAALDGAVKIVIIDCGYTLKNYLLF